MKEEINSGEKEPQKLWNKDFFLLWQGQLVSMLGDVLYMIALDFWILEITNSTALMGLLSAVTMLPKIILGPFAGVFIDKWNRRNIVVITDLIRGIVITFVGIAGVFGFIQVWMVFIVGIISGLCSAFFGPSVTALRPELVPKSKLVKANSLTGIANSSMNIIGSAIGGVIYLAIGASYMFLANGISYLISAFSETFIREPKREIQKHEVTFFEDFKSGLQFMWNFKVLKNVFIIASILNLVANSVFILILPYFKEVEFLGPKKYGIFMAVIPVGMLLGSLMLSTIDIKKKHKFNIFRGSIIICMGLIPFLGITKNFYIMLVVGFIAFFNNAIFNTIFDSSITLVIPKEKRGKLFALMGTISGGLQPLGALIGGVLGEIMPIRIAIISLAIIDFVFGIIIVLPKGARDVIEHEYSEESIEDLIMRTNNMYLKESSKEPNKQCC